MNLSTYDMDHFYLLARTILVKDERNLDKFDRAFSATFEGLEQISTSEMLERTDLPEDWLRKLAEKTLSEDDKAEIEALGGFDKLMETLRIRAATNGLELREHPLLVLMVTILKEYVLDNPKVAISGLSKFGINEILKI